jgi:hypothetical protein
MKRCAMQIILLLLLGAIANVAVAWACANTIELGNDFEFEHCAIATIQQGASPHHYYWTILVRKQPGGMRVYSGYHVHDVPWPIRNTTKHPSAIVPAWVVLDPRLNQPGDYQITNGFGIPCLTMTGTSTFDVSELRRWSLQHEYRLQGWCRIYFLGRFPYDIYLPLRPIWPGFAFNSIFYALILALLWFTPITLRRWRRVHTGRCPHCAYDLQHEATAGCPECGWNRAECPAS